MRGVTKPAARVGFVTRIVGAVGERIIYALIRLFGRVVRVDDVPWLAGPTGGDYIGDRAYHELAAREGLTVERRADAGLLPDFDVLEGPSFRAGAAPEAVRDFYEHTSRYAVDASVKTFFPLRLGLWLLVKTISRRVNQLNFPVGVLEAMQDVKSEIVALRDGHGAARYTGWFRHAGDAGSVIYAGFYSSARIPGHPSSVVKAVFPMPQGNATVFLSPACNERGEFELRSQGRRFGEPGFYRVQQLDEARLRVWRVRSLVEHLRFYKDAQRVLCCEHTMRFWGMPALTLTYRLRPEGPLRSV